MVIDLIGAPYCSIKRLRYIYLIPHSHFNMAFSIADNYNVTPSVRLRMRTFTGLLVAWQQVSPCVLLENNLLQCQCFSLELATLVGKLGILKGC